MWSAWSTLPIRLASCRRSTSPWAAKQAPILLRRKRPGAERALREGLAPCWNLDVVDLGPAVGERAITGRERIARLSRGLDVERVLEVGEVIDGAIGRPAVIGERQLVAELYHAS